MPEAEPTSQGRRVARPLRGGRIASGQRSSSLRLARVTGGWSPDFHLSRLPPIIVGPLAKAEIYLR
jgi:hypothetical protein